MAAPAPAPAAEAGAGAAPADGAGSAASGPPPLRYCGGDALEIPGLPTRADLVRAADAGGHLARLDRSIASGDPVLFIPVDVHEADSYASGAPAYQLNLFGALTSGEKAHVVLDGVEVYFDVRVPAPGAPRPEGASGPAPPADPAKLGDFLRQALTGADVSEPSRLLRLTDHEAFPILGYRVEPVAWKRLFFPTTRERKRALLAVRELGLETASDDLTSYYRMVARVHGLVLTDWGTLKDYTYYRGGVHKEGPSTAREAPRSPLCAHVFRVDVRKFRPLVDPLASKAVRDRGTAARARAGLDRDKTLVLTWDIETWSGAQTGDVPRAGRPTDHAFMICATVHWKDDSAPLHQICLVDIATAPDARWTTVECGSEENILRAFAVTFRHFAPDIITGFNDAGYDWPFVIEKAHILGCLGFMYDAMTAAPRGRRGAATADDAALQWNVQGSLDGRDIRRIKTVKIGAGTTATVVFLKTPGCVPVDARVMFQQLFPKAEVGNSSSLNFYLKMCKLDSKADMPYKRMWDIYERRDTAQMREVAHYCVVDAKRCQELLVVRNVVGDRREVAALSFVSFYDAVYYANGHKVGNMLIAHALRRDILCSNINREETSAGKYPGAWVFHPRKGLVPDPRDPGVAALEAARAAYAARPPGAAAEGAARAAAAAAVAAARPGRPVTGLDFASLYPSIIMAYNLSPEKFVATAAEAARLMAAGVPLHRVEFDYDGRSISGWFVRHDGVAEAYGLYPSILMELFGQRAAVKKILAPLDEDKEYMELVLGLAGEAAAAVESAENVEDAESAGAEGAGAEGAESAEDAGAEDAESATKSA